MQKRILCYGDSNTWGAIPDGGRYPDEIRWTGVLQAQLGDEYKVIEVLHTTGANYIVEDIDLYIEARQSSMA